MPEDYVGWPQRRDFPVGGEPVIFTNTEPRSRATSEHSGARTRLPKATTARGHATPTSSATRRSTRRPHATEE